MMEKWDVGFAQRFKERENKAFVGMVVGEVITGLPNLSVSIGKDIILDIDQLVIANRIYYMHYHLDDASHTPVDITLAPGDKVLLMPTSSEQSYYLIDRVGE